MSANHTPVEEVMSRTLEIIPPEEPISEAAAEMRDRRLGALLVPTAPPAIVTKNDILDAVAAESDPATTPVEAIMTQPVETVPPDCPLGEAAAMMTTFGTDHIPVAADDFLGMVSMADVTEGDR
ncbi:cyclic nucleotide-binding/CBS domain-containing protein [Natronomonas sp. LN261]|jgi:CBS domain-containing protein|uniref:CBS domain-containing protein n=1 Tax=Natronomonas sp. LN261 TaxID=2750669 RepID=UPI001C67EFD7|nr:CBS domain-containing protein [Natronomonas sp. LN261]